MGTVAELSPLERAAYAVEVAIGTHCEQCEAALPYDPETIVRAVLQAIRTPSEAMITAGMTKADTDLASEYQAMIDSLLEG